MSTEPKTKPFTFLRHLREILSVPASGQDQMDIIVRLISEYMVTDVCSLYVLRQDDVLELYATQGLSRMAVHQTTLKIGEGVIGHIAQTQEPIRLSNAPTHDIFSYKPETNEDIFRAMAGVPLLKEGEVIGVLAVQNIMQRAYSDEDIELLETVALFLSAMLLGKQDVSLAKETVQNLKIMGISIHEGLVSGNVYIHEPYVRVTRFLADDIDAEHRRLAAALEQLRHSVDHLIENAASGLVNNDTKNIMETYKMFTHDKGWFRRLSAAVAQGLTAEAAVDRIRSETKAHLNNLDNPYMRERHHDFEDLANRLLRVLSGKPIQSHKDLPDKTILIASSMGPADLLEYDLRKICGIIVEEASQTAHVSILARSLSIPMVGRVPSIIQKVKNYQPILMDADKGAIRLNPTEDVIEFFQKTKETKNLLEAERAQMRDVPACSKDGVRAELMMNAGLSYDIPHLEASNADGIGLFRTELQLLMSSGHISFREQVTFFKNIFDKVGHKPIYFRTPDIGGDKIPSAMDSVQRYEHNPAMGFRAIRISMDRPALLRMQIRAMIYASEGRPLNIMLPMISDIYEVQASREMAFKELERCKKLGVTLPATFQIGIMLEVPAIAYRIQRLKGICDFISVGSNDLLQFLFAADRDNPRTSSRYDRLSPTALSFLKFIYDEAEIAGIPISLCGEMASKPLEAMTLMALGYRRLSIGAAQIPQIKMQMLKTDVGKLRLQLLPKLTSSERTLRKYIRSIVMEMT
ncbi:MAG: phosphoenolpyruvate--protein phosphotransferase [Pseudomonadota bacterium]